MNKEFCKRVDEQLLVEKYVSGKLKGRILEEFEEHLKECETHLQAVMLEKALQRGVREFARGELKTKLQKRIEKKEDSKFLLLRYAAILFIAVITPLLLYYQFSVQETDFNESVPATAEYKSEKTADSLLLTPSSPAPPQAQPQSRIPSAEAQKPKTVSAEKKVGTALKKTAENSKSEAIPVDQSARDELAQPVETDIMDQQKDLSGLALQSESLQTTDLRSLQSASAHEADRQKLSSTTGSSLEIILDRKIQTEREKLNECLYKYLSEQDLHEYWIKLSIHIIENGTISDIKIIEASARSQQLENCLINQIKDWRFRSVSGAEMIEKKIFYKQD